MIVLSVIGVLGFRAVSSLSRLPCSTSVMLISRSVLLYFEMTEFLEFWEKVERVRQRAIREIEEMVEELKNYIASKYGDELERVGRELGVELELGVEADGIDPTMTRPVLYVWREGGVDEELIEHVYEKLGSWARDARLLVKPKPRGV